MEIEKAPEALAGEVRPLLPTNYNIIVELRSQVISKNRRVHSTLLGKLTGTLGARHPGHFSEEKRTHTHESSNFVNGLSCLISEEMQTLSSCSDVDSANEGESDSKTEYIPALRRLTHASSSLMINVITRGSARPAQKQTEQPKVSQKRHIRLTGVWPP
ncbi:unnamed protein product [Bursaphelenchus xylophilus]|uniref:(pine wood nematode) hypothetical protein n=1 Tax=Bursaphelenchus xylophilus TaxID=6326 RepID=A0A1I7SFD4_BURXY|nr:unnamed protein product [Bursaphelenchus xylophilus]CAG9089645.1 unnamed protein product [Bursaphelenchus xylophilus]